MHLHLPVHLIFFVALGLAVEHKQQSLSNFDDTELLIAESSGSRKAKENKNNNKPDTEEKVKTLSQQVADGKYGLIQKELFGVPPKRPGVLSYDLNSEVPKDNADNLGGLDQNEIWLAENHLLVLRGGKFSPPDTSKHENIGSVWPPIDSYKAKSHQVRIPAHPKVPPPFPVQLTKDGPLQILGTNSSRTINASDASSLYTIPASDGTFYQPDAYLQAGYPDKTNTAAGPASLPVPFNVTRDDGSGVRIPTSSVNATLPPFLGYLPPGAVVLPPPGNQTDLYDDDDPSIYYPPPYSFFYPKDNSSLVPPGPLVPGIVLPPPPNFFTLLEETTTPKLTTMRKPQRQRKPTTTHINVQIRPTTTSLPPTTEKPIKIYPVKHSYYSNEINPTTTTTTTTTMAPKIITVLPVRPDRTYIPRHRENPAKNKKRPDNVTVLRPVKPPSRNYGYENEIPNKPFAHYGLPPTRTAKKKVLVTTTQVPLRYYTTSNNINTNSYQSEKYNTNTKSRPAQYFYYEEPHNKPGPTTRVPSKPNTYRDSAEQYFVQPKPSPSPRPRRPQYIYVTGRPYNTQKPRFRFIQQPVKDTFSLHIAQLQKQINHYITTTKTTLRPSPRPVYQYSFEAANYQQQHDAFRPSPHELDHNQFRPVPVPKYNVEIQQAIEIVPSTEGPRYRKPSGRPVFIEQSTERPNAYHSTSTQGYGYDKVTQKAKYRQNTATPRPLSQYSFEVTPNPIYQGYYTRPDEGYFDENTKHYFTVFGKKLPAVTTPIPNVEITPSIELSYSQLKEHGGYQEEQQKPISLAGDTYVNNINPKPTIDPDAEYVPIKNTNSRPNYPKVIRYTARPPVYLPPGGRDTESQGPEIIKAIPIEVPSNDGDGSFISYQLPGDQGAHFYFLTPQLAERQDQGSGYFYSRPANARIRRNDDNDKNR